MFQFLNVLHAAYASTGYQMKMRVCSHQGLVHIRGRSLKHAITTDICTEHCPCSFIYICFEESIQFHRRVLFPSIDADVSVPDIGTQYDMLCPVPVQPLEIEFGERDGDTADRCQPCACIENLVKIIG